MPEWRQRPLAWLLALAWAAAGCQELSGLDEPAQAPPELQPQGPMPAWPAGLARLGFGTVPVLGAEETQAVYQPLMELLSAHLGVPVELVVTRDYAELTALLARAEVDVGLFTALSYVQAREAMPAVRPILRQVVAGSGSYLGYVYTTVENPAEHLADLAGRSVCWADLQSTSGYLYPRALLRAKGRDPDTFFGRVEFGGNHLVCLERVLAGQVDAAATYAGAFSAGRARGLAVDRVKIVAKTPRIPYNALTVRPGLPAAAEERIRRELSALSTRSLEGVRALNREMRLNAWAPARDGDYDSVREVLRAERGSIVRGPDAVPSNEDR
jgi:phosphate/phosphite/phosphonate ABC transporter binding protein